MKKRGRKGEIFREPERKRELKKERERQRRIEKMREREIVFPRGNYANQV